MRLPFNSSKRNGYLQREKAACLYAELARLRKYEAGNLACRGCLELKIKPLDGGGMFVLK